GVVAEPVAAQPVGGVQERGNADVVRGLSEQLKPVHPEEIDQIVSRFPADQQAQARSVLAHASSFGSMESFNTLRDALVPHLTAREKLYLPGGGSVADNLAYLDSKGSFRGNGNGAIGIKTTDTIGPKSVVILDDVVLHRIQNDPAFAKSLADNNCTL